jgi:hypothetical protein
MKDLGAVFGSVYGWERPGLVRAEGLWLTKERSIPPTC